MSDYRIDIKFEDEVPRKTVQTQIAQDYIHSELYAGFPSSLTIKFLGMSAEYEYVCKNFKFEDLATLDKDLLLKHIPTDGFEPTGDVPSFMYNNYKFKLSSFSIPCQSI